MAEPEPLERSHLLTILTTEQYVLQGARSTALTDMQGRANLFMTAVSSALVALAFIGQTSHLGEAFAVTTLVLVATLWIVGILTFVRVVQIAVEDAVLAFGIARIRRRYVELAPELAPLFVRSIHDDLRGMEREMGVGGGRLQLLMPTSTMVLFATGVLGGVEAAFATNRFGAGLGIAVGIGVVVAIVQMLILNAFAIPMWKALEREFPARNPSPASSNRG